VGGRAVEVEAGSGAGADAPRSPAAEQTGTPETEADAMTVLTETLDRSIVIRARPASVFRYFTDTDRWAAWWGAGSSIEAKPGGQMRIRYPDGTEAAGEVVEIDTPHRIVFTYGYVKGDLIPPGGSRVTIDVEPHADGTRVALTHEFADAKTRDHHL